MLNTDTKAMRRILAPAVAVLLLIVLGACTDDEDPTPKAVASTPEVTAPITQGQACLDGGGIAWQLQVVWAGTDPVDPAKVDITAARWSTNAQSVATDSRVDTYDAAGSLKQTLVRTATFDYNGASGVGTSYTGRNPLNQVSSPGKVKVKISVGKDGDGKADCSMTFIQPSRAALTNTRIAAAGDISCDPNSSYFSGAKDPAQCQMEATADVVRAIDPARVMPLGDLQYGGGSSPDFTNGYAKNWGEFKAISRPVIGNHEYEESNSAPGYTSFFSSSQRGATGLFYYAYDFAGSRVYALNTSEGACDRVSCAKSSSQEKWFRADLAANQPTKCKIAAWHHPTWVNSAQHNPATYTQALLDDFINQGGDAVLWGHAHQYERFNRSGLDAFIVGTGGRNFHPAGTDGITRVVANYSTFGALQLAVGQESIDYNFKHIAGKSFTDSGTIAC